MVYFLPESPVWLRSKNRLKEADSSSAWLKLQATTIPLSVNHSNISSIIPVNGNDNQKTINPHSRKVLFTRPILLPLGIGLALMVLQQISGIDAIIFFTVEIFRASGNIDSLVFKRTTSLLKSKNIN